MSDAKLSRLQREILALAYVKRQTRQTVEVCSATTESQPFRIDHPVVDLFYPEILVNLYGFPPARNHHLAGQHFSRAAIGERRYDAAVSAASRTTGRLMKRGLLTMHEGQYAGWVGFSLTDEAVEIVMGWSTSQPVGRDGNGSAVSRG